VSDEDDSPVGEFIRRQRKLQELSMRQFANLVGISNPYLSQIERGLRAPSERVLDAIAEQLHVSADVLQAHARPPSETEGDEPEVLAAIRADRSLTAKQRQALIEVYTAFVSSRSKGQ
jgi:transcriptional regulator with XRE-family HTH domain